MGGRHLTPADRKIIEERWLAGDSVADIAECVGAHRATIYLELKRGDTGVMDRNGRSGYSAKLAQTEIFVHRHPDE